MEVKEKRKWLNVNIWKVGSDRFRVFLRQNHLRYETSEMGKFIHFEVYVNDEERKQCDAFLLGEPEEDLI